jgi:hypothetical protein
MSKRLVSESFIVRIYRADTEDKKKINGLVEALDGSGKPAPFRDAGELAGLLNGGACAARKRERKARRSGREKQQG